MTVDGGKKGRKSAGRKRAASRQRVPAKAPTPPTSPALTTRELARATDDTVDAVNRAIRRAGLENDDAADRLFKDCFDNDVGAALSPDENVTQRYAAVLARAGKSLCLDADDLRDYVRVGALNHRYARTPWKNLDWSVRLELLPLLSKPDEFQAFRRGIAFANGTNVGVRAVREWVQRNVPKLPGTKGRPRGFTLATGQKLVQSTVKLADAEARAGFVRKVKALPPDKRRAFTDDLDAAIENLRALRGEIETEE